MAEEFPSNFDLIVIGTGLTESIVAAAASRIGKQVLHIDHRDYYGSNWSSFSFNNLDNIVGSGATKDSKNSKSETEAELDYLVLKRSGEVFNIEEKWNVPDDDPVKVDDTESTNDESNILPPVKKITSKAEILSNSRKFTFDLSPKILYSRGEMVEVLISSGISRYAEFKNVTNICAYDSMDKKLIKVPCSRADVFASKDISMVEKRLLMRTMTACVDFEQSPDQESESRTFGDFLTSHQITGKIRQYIVETVAMAEESTNLSNAICNVRKFVNSIGRFGNTPFLWTLYGSGELPQCFCRCSAVFGGIYCLKRATQSIALSPTGQAIGIKSENQLLKSSFVVVEDSLNPTAIIKSGISRAILITDKPMISEDQVSLINFPSLDGKNIVRILELPASAMACPRGQYVIHLVTPQTTTAVEDLSHAIAALFDQENTDHPNILWSLHFNMHEYENPTNTLPSNVYVSPGPNCGLDLDDYVTQAKRIFLSMFPEEEFLPKVPDPEDVVIEGDEDLKSDETEAEDPKCIVADAVDPTVEHCGAVEAPAVEEPQAEKEPSKEEAASNSEKPIA